MTSKVTIEAHVGTDKEVCVGVLHGNNQGIHTLKDGERKEITVYDNIRVVAFERAVGSDESPFPEGTTQQADG